MKCEYSKCDNLSYVQVASFRQGLSKIHILVLCEENKING